jgi:carbamoyl-phosphate synthase large subunit
MVAVDEPLVVPPIQDAGYVPQTIEIARRSGARALIPTIDPDLPMISANRAGFDAVGCAALVGEPGVIQACGFKDETFRFLQQHGIDTPDTFTVDDVRRHQPRRFPYFIKPRAGSASIGAHKINDDIDLDYYGRKIASPIVQEFVAGREYTLDVYVGLDGIPRCVVPRWRWQTRTGEVVKGVVVKDPALIAAGKRVAEALGPSTRGLITLQCIVSADGRIRFIEINPRFGGGAPMSIAAGADFPGWLLQELLGQRPAIALDGFRHGLCMLRFDWSAFVPLPDDLQPTLGRSIHALPVFE